FSSLWKHISPHLLITEVTFPTSREEMAGITGHLTPRLLRGELLEIRKRQGRLPAVLVIHMSPAADEEIRGELKDLGRELEASIIVGNEGMKVLLDAGNIRVL
ncbi:MAG: hypothetical protein HYU86_10585, partial [Chloroflexi bacterium]|nr:hypothetical protein [Chloroflexota bacterium]